MSAKKEIREWILEQAKYGISTWWMGDDFEYFHQTFYKELPAEKVVNKLRRTLNKLEKEGLLKSTWIGLGDAAHEYGTNRMKVWDAVF